MYQFSDVFKMDFDEVTKLALESSIIFKKKVRYGQNFISCMVAMVTNQDYPCGLLRSLRFSPPYTSIMSSRGCD